MARFQTTLTGDTKALVAHRDEAILGSSMTADRDEATAQGIGDAQMMVGAGGGQAIFFTMNTVGKGAFLTRGRRALESFTD
jgi:hypothetical protein